MKMTRRFAFIPVLAATAVLLAASILLAGIGAGRRASAAAAPQQAVFLSAEEDPSLPCID